MDNVIPVSAPIPPSLLHQRGAMAGSKPRYARLRAFRKSWEGVLCGYRTIRACRVPAHGVVFAK